MADLDLPPVPDAAVAAAHAEMPALDPGVIRRCLLEPALPATAAAVLRWAADRLAPAVEKEKAIGDVFGLEFAAGIEHAMAALRALAEEIETT